jgi:hypothetical protein
VLIRCGGCEAVHESTLPACPSCGRCPACGRRRVPAGELTAYVTCRVCGAPMCAACGRCHGCGALRLFDVGACECGHPSDRERVVAVERHFGFSK